MSFFGYFNGAILLSLVLGTAYKIADVSEQKGSPALSQTVSQFRLCGSAPCNQSQYYVGYNRTNKVTLSGQKSDLPPQVDFIFPDTADIADRTTLPDTNEQKVDLEDGNFVSSIHRIEHGQIGLLKKTELINVHSLLNDSSAEATVRLLWGDRVTVISQSLPKGTPVDILIERKILGFGNPVTDNAFYHANSQTFVNGQPIKSLDFNLEKKRGKGEKDQVLGESQANYIIKSKVGDTFVLESLLEVRDGVKAEPTTYQMLNGGDSVEHQIKIANEHSSVICLQSASSKLNSGRCIGSR